MLYPERFSLTAGTYVVTKLHGHGLGIIVGRPKEYPWNRYYSVYYTKKQMIHQILYMYCIPLEIERADYRVK